MRVKRESARERRLIDYNLCPPFLGWMIESAVSLQLMTSLNGCLMDAQYYYIWEVLHKLNVKFQGNFDGTFNWNRSIFVSLAMNSQSTSYKFEDRWKITCK